MNSTTNCNFSDPIDVNPTMQEDYEYSSSTCITVATFPTVSTTTPSTTIPVYAYFTAGDVLIALLLFLYIVLIIFKFTVHLLDKITWKKKWLGYHGGDVEIKNEP